MWKPRVEEVKPTNGFQGQNPLFIPMYPFFVKIFAPQPDVSFHSVDPIFRFAEFLTCVLSVDSHAYVPFHETYTLNGGLLLARG